MSKEIEDKVTEAKYFDIHEMSEVRLSITHSPHSLDTWNEESKNTKSNNSMPSLDSTDLDLMNEWDTLSEEIVEIKKRLIDRNAYNREYLFRNEGVCSLVSNSFAASIVGEGPIIETEDDRVKLALQMFMKDFSGSELRSKRYSIYDLVRDLMDDNLTHAESIYVKKIINKEFTIHRLDIKTLRKVTHDIFGWSKYIQSSLIDSNLPGVVDKGEETEAETDPVKIEEAKEKFYSREYLPGGISYGADHSKTHSKTKIHRVHIPETKIYVFKLFRRPPIDPVLDLLLYKRFMLYYLRKASEKFAGPTLVVTVGTPEMHPKDPKRYKAILNDAAEQAANARFGDAMAIPFFWKVEPVDNSARILEFARVFEWINKEIVNALGSSMALYEARGAELATSKTISESLLRTIIGFREKVGDVLYDVFRSYLRFLEETRGLNSDGSVKDAYAKLGDAEFEIGWPQLKEESIPEIINSVINLYRENILENANEARLLITQKTNIDLEPLKTDDVEDLENKREMVMKRASMKQSYKTFEVFQQDFLNYKKDWKQELEQAMKTYEIEATV